MNIVVNKADDGAIEFLNEGMIIYDITEDMQKHGFDYWRVILADKQWFTPDVFGQFEEEWSRQQREVNQ